MCKSRKSFAKFEQQVSKELVLGCTFACVHHLNFISPSGKIGQRTTRRQIKKDHGGKGLKKRELGINNCKKDPIVCDELNVKVIGLAVSWSTDQVHFLSFMPNSGKQIKYYCWIFVH